MHTKIIALVISFLFVATVVTPMVVGYDHKSLNETELETINDNGIKYDKKTYMKSYIELANGYNIFRKQHNIKNRIVSLGNKWIKLFPPNGEEVYDFGFSVDIDNNYAIIGAPGMDYYNYGSVYIYKKILGSWQEQAVIYAPEEDHTDESNIFGYDVAIDGNYAVISEREGEGSVYVFKRNGDIWEKQTRLFPSREDDKWAFGMSVAIDGDYIIVGSTGYVFFPDRSAVYIFKRYGNEWYEEDRIVPSWDEWDSWSWFGWDVAIDGDYLLVGSVGYQLWDLIYDVDGYAYIFKHNDDKWELQVRFSALDDDISYYWGNGFGWSVDIDGSYAIVGVVFDFYDDTSGSAYIYRRIVDKWEKQIRIITSDIKDEEEFFGASVSIDGRYIIVGAPRNDYDKGGSATIFKRVGNNWKQHIKLHNPDGEPKDWFGWAVSNSGNYAIVGAEDDENNRGSATIFKIPVITSRIKEKVMNILNL